MKVLLLNGSPNQHGCTHTALCEVARAIEESGIETEILWIGNQAVRGCIGCGGCARSGKRRCVFGDDLVNTALDKMQICDGTGRRFARALRGGGRQHHLFSGSHVLRGGSQMRAKVGAAVCSARRAGTTATLDQLSKYFTICGMPIAPSQYWPMVHGSTPEDVRQDEEGMQIMRMLGRNMAYMIRAFALARENGLLPPDMEKPKMRTNFIR